MPTDILSPGSVFARSAAANTPFAIAVMAILAVGSWLVNRGNAAQADYSARAAFLRAMAKNAQAISPELLASYAEEPDWRGRALRAITDATVPESVRAAIRQALAAA